MIRWSFISSQIDYCIVLFQDATSRLLIRSSGTTHITPTPSAWHWFPIKFFLAFTFRAQQSEAPAVWISQEMVIVPFKGFVRHWKTPPIDLCSAVFKSSSFNSNQPLFRFTLFHVIMFCCRLCFFNCFYGFVFNIFSLVKHFVILLCERCHT